MKHEVIKGNWIINNGEVIADSNCQLIESMIKNELTEIMVSEDGWTKRYEDKDGRVWELSYPESQSHGGGPPKLTMLK